MRLELETDKMIAEIEDGIGWMTFNNPARRNALSMEMQRAMAVILERFHASDDVRVIVMKGAGDKAFVSGADISEFGGERTAPSEPRSPSEPARPDPDRVGADKPVVASLRDTAASGGYYAAMAAREIIAESTTLTGSIGVVLVGLGVEGLLESLGVRTDAVQRGRHADIYDPTGERSEESRAVLKRQVERIYRDFVALCSDLYHQ